MAGSIRVGLRFMARVAAKLAAITPPAWSYFNLIGTVDMREQGGYYDRISGSVALYVDTPPSQQGGYFNRE